MQLHKLLNDQSLNLPIEITGIELDSREIKPNSLFVALSGTKVDGRQFIQQAIGNGAVAVLLDAPTESLAIHYHDKIPLITIPNLTKQLGNIAARFYEYPAKKITVVGVTGTNGKTSCTHFIAQALSHMGKTCGVIGTLGSGVYPNLGVAGLTTPHAVDLQKTLHQFVKQGVQVVAMEVSSHSIHQNRITGIDFDVGVFTNLTQDHLDYHGNMQNYAEVKQRFFIDFPIKYKVINADDGYGLKWLEAWQRDDIYSYSTSHPNRLGFKIDADQIEMHMRGLAANVKTPWGVGSLQTHLLGTFNLSNVLAVLTTLCLQNIELKQALDCLQHLEAVPGRMQKLGGGDLPLVIVDYAHTPDALQKTLVALRTQIQGKLICIFGCGGDRDQSKRPQMAQIAEAFADQVIVTNDNPRHEDPENIVTHIRQGFKHPQAVQYILDRAKAIEKSLQYANQGDCILIAGKGAEHYQQIGEQKLPFDDVTCAQECLDSLLVRGR